MTDLKSIVCPGCPCLCDDIEIVRSNTSGVELQNLCAIGKHWFEIPLPAVHCLLDGQPTSLAKALETACQWIDQSRAPLITGTASLTLKAQQSAWKLADLIGATIDTNLTRGGRGSTLAMQRTGKVTATLGEIAQRSNLIVFWYCDPLKTHPRLLDRHLNRKTKPRRLVVVDQVETETAQLADQFIKLPRDAAATGLAVLQALLKDVPLDESMTKEATGVPFQDWRGLVDLLSDSNYGAWFYGHPQMDSQFDLESDRLSRFLRALNDHARVVGLGLRSDENAISAESVFTWSSGFPFAINLNRRFPRFNNMEYSTAAILERDETDLVLLMESEHTKSQLDSLSRSARNSLDLVPLIVLSSIRSDWNRENIVVIPVARPGQTATGDLGRLDDVLLPVTVLPDSIHPAKREAMLPDASTILNQLRESIHASQSNQ